MTRNFNKHTFFARVIWFTLGLFFLLLLFGVRPALADKTHPAIVRVLVPEGHGTTSYGSGTLVAASGNTGVVLTNWHVVRDRKGQVEVLFPDGFRSAAQVLRTDRDWDLAALLVWRPSVKPVPISNRAPMKGEPLTIAGYGSGNFRWATGRCVTYLAPGDNMPCEIVELSARARQGDSGGPILNQHGELAGVLFGSVFGKTSGSHAMRVRNFLSSIDPQLADGRLAPQPQLPQAHYAQNAMPGPRVAAEYKASRWNNEKGTGNIPSQKPSQQTSQQASQKTRDHQGAWSSVSSTASNQVPPPKGQPAPQWQAGGPSSHEEKKSGKTNPLEVLGPSSWSDTLHSNEGDGPVASNHIGETSAPAEPKNLTLWEHLKNVLCLIGGIAILVQLSKLLPPNESKNVKNKGKKNSK